MLIYPLCDYIRSCNFTDGWFLTSSLDILKHFLVQNMAQIIFLHRRVVDMTEKFLNSVFVRIVNLYGYTV